MLPRYRNPPGYEDPPDEEEELYEEERYEDDPEDWPDDTPINNYHNFNPERGW